MFPSAEEIARAIGAACTETGDKPFTVVSGELLPVAEDEDKPRRRGRPRFRHPVARIYAYTVLVEEFAVRGLSCESVAAEVGAPKPASFVDKFPYYAAQMKRATLARIKARFYGVGHFASFTDSETQPPGGEPAGEAVIENKVGPYQDPAVEVVRTFAQPEKRKRSRSTNPPIRLVDRLTTRRKPATIVQDNTADYLGDPDPSRSALAGAEPWVPYEERCKHRQWRELSSSTLPRTGKSSMS